MSTFKPKEEHKCHGGIQKIYQFDNGYGASVIRHEHSYGSERGLWELGVLSGSELTYDTEITNDVIGHLTEVEVQKYLMEISQL
jgi:hypothetical protein